MPKKTIENKIVDLANDLLDAEYNIYSDNVNDDDILPDNVELLLKEIDITKKHLEQLVFMLRKYNKSKK